MFIRKLKKPDVYLHIGTPKTGTTSFQKWCARHRDSLREQGVLYPVSLGNVNHVRAMVYASDFLEGDGFFERNSVFDSDGHEEFRQSLEESFAGEVKESGCSKILISNEHLYSRINTAERIERLKGLLLKVAGNVTVIVHVRPQIDLLVSNASQAARLQKIVTTDWFLGKAVSTGNKFLNQSSTIAEWESVFGESNVKVVPFKRSPDLVDYVVFEMGLDKVCFGESLRENEALGWRAMAVSNILIENGFGKQLGERFKKLLAAMPKSERLKVGLAVAEQVQQRFSSENDDLIARKHELEFGDLDPDWEKYNVPPNLYKLDCVMEISQEIAVANDFLSKE